ncbi:EpsG family protein [Geobacillus sp. Manikaran-105]|uniref:EpsG family protein n=1 Tax=Geobacillus sp. Manikaran-105 TaxID=2055940 RepID=UPI000C286204|nr:EpsG family protein [Geobacillus sp. Manikaran-105]PJW13248.1 EpsG family protein [Geobacillus sp. Manikaran-105]
MTVFWITLALVYLFSFSARILSTNKSINVNLLEVKQPNKTLTLITILVLVLVSGLRNNIGDTFFYMHSYSLNRFTLDKINFKGDFGFNIIQALLQKISTDPQILIFFCALVTNVLIIITFYKYSMLFELAVYVYITSGIYLVTMNGVRQYLAAAITFAGTHYLFKRDWKKYFLIVLLASTIHKSALILLLAYFFSNGKSWGLRISLLLGIGILIIVGYQQFSSILFTALEDTQYGHYKDFSEGGANIIRVLVTLVPLIIAFIGRKRLEKITSHSDVIVNMSILNLFFMLISTQNWIFARVAIYFNLYHILLVTWVVNLFEKKDRKLIYLAIIFCYLIFYFYEQVITLKIEYQSNYF